MVFDLLAEMERDGFRSIRKSNSRGGQWNGPCILDCCGLGDDRLWVQPHFGEYGWFKCNVCSAKGSGVDYLMMKRGWSKREALAYVGWKPKDGNESQFVLPKSVLAGEVYPTHSAPCQEWQTPAKAFVKYCVEKLWSEQGSQALDYLRSRGLTDETMKAAQLGYNPSEMERPGAKWGRKGKLILKQGIIIPWFIGEDLWRITIRDEKAIDHRERYKQAAGGSNGLYLAYTLGYDRPVILVEGEFDALSIAQEAGHDVSVVATGSTEGAHTARWIAALARKDLVLVAFDAEERGDKASQWWLDRLECAHRLRPWWKDANQMLQDGVDLLNDWILPSLYRILDELNGQEVSIVMPSGDVCHACRKPFPNFEGWDPEKIPTGDIIGIDPVEGEMYCKICRPDLFEQMLETA